MSFRVRTTRGYNLFDVASALQKSIRRQETDQAVYWAMELYFSGYWRYVWKRFLVISAEDCAGCITQEIKALHEAFLTVNHGNAAMDCKSGRLFITKSAILLSQAYKCRDADHAQVFLYDRKAITDEQAQGYLDQLKPEERVEIPEYAYDCHTQKGRKAGKTRDDFFKSEAAALKPRVKGLFDDLIEPGD